MLQVNCIKMFDHVYWNKKCIMFDVKSTIANSYPNSKKQNMKIICKITIRFWIQYKWF